MAKSFTTFTDVAGQITRTARSPWISSAAIAVAAEDLEAVRQAIPVGFPKWRDSGRREIALMVEVLKRWGSGMSATSVRVIQPAWEDFWMAAAALAAAQTRQDLRPAGLTKAPNIVRAQLMLSATTVASSVAVRNLLGAQAHDGLLQVHQRIIFDDEFGGETREFIIDFWKDVQFGAAKRLGVEMTMQDFQLVDDEAEPLMMLADYLAGLRHALSVGPRGGPQMPVSPSKAHNILRVLAATGRLESKQEDFSMNYRNIFGDAMTAAGI